MTGEISPPANVTTTEKTRSMEVTATSKCQDLSLSDGLLFGRKKKHGQVVMENGQVVMVVMDFSQWEIKMARL